MEVFRNQVLQLLDIIATSLEELSILRTNSHNRPNRDLPHKFINDFKIRLSDLYVNLFIAKNFNKSGIVNSRGFLFFHKKTIQKFFITVLVST